jgi:hypothetical protein
MPKSKQTATPVAESVRDSFDALQKRFMSLLSRLQVVCEVLGNCDNVPNELAPAAYVLNDTTRDAEQLWEGAECWYMHHEHTPNTKEVQS